MKHTGDFPSHLIDPKEKNDKWCKDYMRAAYSKRSRCYTYQRRKDWVENYKYADGNQPNDKYVNWLSKYEDEYKRKIGYMNLDLSILSPIPKFMDAVIGYLSNIDYRTRATAINPEAVDKREEYRHRMQAMMQLAEFEAEIEQMAGMSLGGDQEMLPETEEELNIMMHTSYQTNEERFAELATKAVKDQSDWDEIKLKLYRDWFVTGVNTLEVTTNPVNGAIQINHWSPPNVIHEEFEGFVYDGEYIGVIETKTLGEVSKECDKPMTEKQLMEVAKAHMRYTNSVSDLTSENSYINPDNNYEYYESQKLQVLKMYWYSWDYKKKERKQLPNGETYVFDKPFKTRLGTKTTKTGAMSETYEVSKKTVYQGYWVLGTDFVYNCGKHYDISRDRDNPKECHLPGKLIRFANKSHIERLMPLEDAIHQNWLRLQNAVAKAKPKGAVIDLSAIENLTIDGKPVPARQAIEMYNHTGDLIVRRSTGNDLLNPTYGETVKEMEGGLGSQANDFISLHNFYIMEMREVSGINEIFSAAPQIAERKALGVAKMEMAATENSLSLIVKRFFQLNKKVTIDILSKLQIRERNDTLKWLRKKIGPKLVDAITEAHQFGHMEFNLEFIKKPGHQEKQYVRELIMTALNKTNNQLPGGIEFDDALYLLDLVERDQLELAQIVMSQRIRKKRERDQQYQERSMQVQSQEIQKQQAAAAQMKMQEEKIETDEKIRFDEAATQHNIRENAAKQQGESILESQKARYQIQE